MPTGVGHPRLLNIFCGFFPLAASFLYPLACGFFVFIFSPSSRAFYASCHPGPVVDDRHAQLTPSSSHHPSLRCTAQSDEEEISESETGHAFSPVDSHKRSGTLGSIMSIESSHSAMLDPVDRPAYHRLLSPFPSTGKRSRPVSMDTVKRSSTATFATDACTIFDHDDDMIIELPSPNSTTPLQSPIYLQPAVYVPSEPLTSPRNSFRSSSSISLYSDDESDVFVAEKVTSVYSNHEATRSQPLLSESSLNAHSASRDSSDGSIYSNDDATKSQPLLSETNLDRGRSRLHTRPSRGKVQGSLSALDTMQQFGPRRLDICEPMSASAAEAPHSMSFRARSMSFSRPQTPVAERHRRLQKEPPTPRPPSAQSLATFSLFPQGQAQSYGYARDDSRNRSTSCSHSAASSEYSLPSSQPTSRTGSPSPYCSPVYNRSRSGSIYSVSSMSTTTGKRPSMPYRGSIIKGSGMLSGYSSSSLRAELDNGPMEQLAEVQEPKSKTKRKKSLKQLKPLKTESSESSTKSFVDFMLRGKRKSVIKNF
ncbi:hypothetical protein BJX68DRAFT_276032 [Aspergillus pseudodeflectus]|uniref:Cell wall proline rich protein n=1 Tax=Aspergillus pseudodeflectus TaxID=176178 RepID=A0ABR4KAK4_9EURO